jgi:hypothetical protein
MKGPGIASAFLLAALTFAGSLSAPAETGKYRAFLKESRWCLSDPRTGKTEPMVPVRFDGTNSDEMDVRGVGLHGRHAQVVIMPIWDENRRPVHIPFSRIELDETGLGGGYLRLDNSKDRFVLLDKSVYRGLRRRAGSGFSYTLYAEDEGNPDVETIGKVLAFLVGAFPAKAKALRSPRVVSLLNKSEKFDGLPENLNTGFYDGDFVILSSHDGRGTFLHRMHELGGMFSIKNLYGHGLTWFVAYDQNFKQGSSGTVREKECFLSEKFDTFFKKAIEAGNGKRTVDEVMRGRVALGGYPIFAWGSGLLWLGINRELESRGEKNLYDLIVRVQESEAAGAGGEGSLDDLLKTYGALGGSSEFVEMAESRFRTLSLGELYDSNREKMRRLGCGPAGFP